MSFINDVFSAVEKLLNNSRIGNLAEGANARGPSDLIQPGDVELVDIILLSEDQQRTYSLMAQAATVDIYESITSPVIFGEITIADSIGLLQNFPIIGEEYVKIVFRTPKNTGEPSSYIFRVNAVKNKQINESNKRLTYTLQLVSAELLRNSGRLVTKRSTENISAVVEQIITEELVTEKPVTVDSTKGIEDVLITRMQPFKAIDFLRQRAVSPRYTSSSFVFFENKNGYFFTTIEAMISEGSKSLESGNTDKIFFFDTLRKDSIENVSMRNILAYNHITFADAVSQVAEGGLQNRIQEFDLITGNIRRLTYTDNIGNDQFVESSSTSAGLHTTGFVKKHGQSTTVTKVVPFRSDKPETQLSEKLSILQAYAQKITQNIVQVHVYGDSDITVGQMIQCQFPSGVDADDQSGLSRLDSGNYLVSKARHMITMGDRPQYSMALELIKGDLQESL